MKQFKTNQSAFKETRKQIFKRSIPVLIIAAIAGVGISFINSKNADKETEIESLFIIIPVITISLGVGVTRGAKRQKALLESYTLTITNNMVSRDQINTQPVSIYFNDIKEIIKNANGSFVIKGRESNDTINIPAQMKNYTELENTLSAIAMITKRTEEKLLEKYKTFLSLLMVASMFTVYIANNKILVVISGIICFVILSWGLYELRTNKNVDEKTKKSSLWVLIPLISVIGVMILKLTGNYNN